MSGTRDCGIRGETQSSMQVLSFFTFPLLPAVPQGSTLARPILQVWKLRLREFTLISPQGYVASSSKARDQSREPWLSAFHFSYCNMLPHPQTELQSSLSLPGLFLLYATVLPYGLKVPGRKDITEPSEFGRPRC